MLGLGRREKPTKNWQWHVGGKHPAARDFFDCGPRSLMAEAFADWIRRGAESLATVSKEMLVRPCSWRFWAKTPETGILTCGVMRNSCDSAGRPFPLLVMGSGTLEDWEENWQLLPFACEGLWRQMEQLASKNYDSFETFQADVQLLRPPQRQWQEMNMEQATLVETNRVQTDCHFDPDMLQENKELFVSCRDSGQNDFFTMINKVHSLLKTKDDAVPNSLFMGGVMEDPGIVLFKRPLSVQDFQRMWVPAAN